MSNELSITWRIVAMVDSAAIVGLATSKVAESGEPEAAGFAVFGVIRPGVETQFWARRLTQR